MNRNLVFRTPYILHIFGSSCKIIVALLTIIFAFFLPAHPLDQVFPICYNRQRDNTKFRDKETRLFRHNNASVAGGLIRPVEVRESKIGEIATFSLASCRKRKNQETGQWEDDPNGSLYLDCKLFPPRSGENFLLERIRGCEKGSLLFVTGELLTESWDDKTSGQRRSKIVLRVNDVHHIPRESRGQTDAGDAAEPDAESAPRQPASRPPAPRQATSQKSARVNPPVRPVRQQELVPADGEEEDIPF